MYAAILQYFSSLVLRILKSLSSHNPSQNIWHKPKKYCKTGQEFDNLICNFACFLTAIVNLSFLQRNLGTCMCLQLRLTFL